MNSDWPAFATGGRLVVTNRHALYDTSAQVAQQRLLTGGAVLQSKDEAGLLPFDMPPWVALVNAPFAALPGSFGARLWTFLLLVALLAGFWLLAPAERRWQVLPAFAAVPAALVAVNSQTDGLVVLGLGAAWALWGTGRPYLAGLALSACLVKPQLVIPLAVALPVARQWRVLAGWATGGIVLLVSTLALDPSLVVAWPRFLATQAGHVGTELAPAGLVWAARLPHLTSLVTAAAVVVVATATVLVLASRRESRAAAALVFAGGLLAAPHALGSDLVLLSAALLVWGEARWWDWVALSVLALGAALLKETMGTTILGIALIAIVLARLSRRRAVQDPVSL